MLSLKGIGIGFSNFALRDVTFDVEAGSYLALLGPTGAGKTVLLETIAGLLVRHEGEIRSNGRDITSLQPEQRGIGMVYQDCCLFPHLNVRDNISFGLRVRKIPTAQIDKKVRELAALVKIEHLLDRGTSRLSGGEKQKVALARALAPGPSVLLLDEPLSALDPENREALRDELHRLHRNLRITIIHVTHDFQEAMSVADKIVVLGKGKVQQIGTPAQIFREPNSVFVARFTMAKNIIPGKVIIENDGYVFTSENARFRVGKHFPGPCYAVLRPEDINVVSESKEAPHLEYVPGTLTSVIDNGTALSLQVDVPPAYYCTVPRASRQGISVAEGQRVFLEFKTSSVRLLDS